MRFQSKPTSAHQKIPGLRTVEITFDQSASGLVFPSPLLLHKVQIDAPPSSASTAKKGLLAEDESTPHKLSRLLSSILGVGGITPSINLIADLCQTSPRSLHRKLKESGVTFQQLLDEVRLEQAQTYLADSEWTIKRIAFELGYSGSNNFVRAFKRLTGLTPNAFRIRQDKS
jgi:AraC-like DNA-binding protein